MSNPRVLPTLFAHHAQMFALAFLISIATGASAQTTSAPPSSTAVASDYVGSDACATCHEAESKSFNVGPHWRTVLYKSRGTEWQGCEACHGPGKAHSEG